MPLEGVFPAYLYPIGYSSFFQPASSPRGRTGAKPAIGFSSVAPMSYFLMRFASVTHSEW